MGLQINPRIVLNALCYALEQATTNGIEVTRNINSNQDMLKQLKELVDEINKIVPLLHEHWLEQMQWYNENQIERIEKATTLEECFFICDPDIRILDDEEDYS